MRPRVDGLIAFTNVAGNGINWMATVIDRSARPTTTGRRVGTTPLSDSNHADRRRGHEERQHAHGYTAPNASVASAMSVRTSQGVAGERTCGCVMRSAAEGTVPAPQGPSADRNSFLHMSDFVPRTRPACLVLTWRATGRHRQRVGVLRCDQQTAASIAKKLSGLTLGVRCYDAGRPAAMYVSSFPGMRVSLTAL